MRLRTLLAVVRREAARVRGPIAPSLIPGTPEHDAMLLREWGYERTGIQEPARPDLEIELELARLADQLEHEARAAGTHHRGWIAGSPAYDALLLRCFCGDGNDNEAQPGSTQVRR